MRGRDYPTEGTYFASTETKKDKHDISILRKPRTDSINNYVILLTGFERREKGIEVSVMYAFHPRITHKGTYADIETISADILENAQRFMEYCQAPNNFRGAK